MDAPGPRDMLTVDHLTKRFGGFLAVNEVSFEVRPGEILGLIGPNGPGKSTIFKMLAGALTADGGWLSRVGRAIPGAAHRDTCYLAARGTLQVPRRCWGRSRP